MNRRKTKREIRTDDEYRTKSCPNVEREYILGESFKWENVDVEYWTVIWHHTGDCISVVK